MVKSEHFQETDLAFYGQMVGIYFYFLTKF